MAITLADRFEVYRGNMTSGMLSLLSQQLDVSEDSLELLGVGFYPAKEAWVFPERDAAGEIIGLILRTHDGFKFTVTGSKRGLTYVLNPDYEKGDRKYDAGKHNWIRAYDAGVICPKCGKDDWCLVSRGDPADPPAVICGRVEQGAHKKIGDSGFLHILRSDGASGGVGAALAHAREAIVVVEGQSDVLAAMDIGLSAVGRPNNVAGLKLLKELLIKRTVIVVGENDAPDKYGNIPGVVGMEKAFEALYNAGCITTRVLPPEGSKDLRAWITRFDLTQEEFLSYVDEHGDTRRNADILQDDTGIIIAKYWVSTCRTIDDLPTVRCYKGRWMEFTDNRYKMLSKEALRGELYRYLDGRYYFKEVKGVDEPTRFRPTANKISDVVDALYSYGPISDDPPHWLVDDPNLPDPVNLIQFKNGILDVNEYISTGNVKLYEPTPKLFSLTAVPHAFDPDKQSLYWTEYLEGIFNGDNARIRLLQQWFGYNLVPDMSFEKMMFLIGRPRSGKGTVIAAMSAMLGDEQVCSSSLASLSGQFGYESLIGKLAVLLADAKAPRKGSSEMALEKILQITGGDAVGVERKYVSTLPQFHLQCRFTIAMNLLPQLPDHAAALEPRLNVLAFPNSYVGCEDRTIKQKMKCIAGDILPWALEGLRDLRESGEFCLPTTSIKVINEFKSMASPVFSFLQEYCDLCFGDESVYVSADLLYDAWKSWTATQNMRPEIRSQFLQRVTSMCPEIVIDTHTVGDKETTIYRGLCLKAWAEKEIGE